MTIKTVWCCSRCGGTNVEQVIHVWQNPNTEEIGDDAGGWDGESYCNDCCDDVMLEPDEREVEEPDPHPHTVTIAWGSESYRAADDEALDPYPYRFATKAELDAFMLGCHEAYGWMGFEVTEDSRNG